MNDNSERTIPPTSNLVTVKRYDMTSHDDGSHQKMEESEDGGYVTYEAYAAILQAVTDPENQPSQFGTTLTHEPPKPSKDQTLGVAEAARIIESNLALRVENERLRAAHQVIIDEGDYTAPEGMKHVAREALSGDSSAPGPGNPMQAALDAATKPLHIEIERLTKENANYAAVFASIEKLPDETTAEPPLEFYIATYGRRVWDTMPEIAKQVWRDHVAKGTHSPVETEPECPGCHGPCGQCDAEKA